MSACLKEQAGQRRSHPKECYPKLFLPQHTVRLVPGQGWQRSQWQRRCWMTLSLSPVPRPDLQAPCPRPLMLLWETAGRRESPSFAANPRLSSICSWPIPCEHLCSWPIGCFHAAWLPLRGGGRLRGAEAGLAPCWVPEVPCGESLPWSAVSRLVCPPCFCQCWRRCKWTLAVQIGSYGDWQRCPSGNWLPCAGAGCELHWNLNKRVADCLVAIRSEAQGCEGRFPLLRSDTNLL